MREHTDRWLKLEAKGEPCIVVHLAEYSFTAFAKTQVCFFVIVEAGKKHIVWTVFDFTSSQVFSYSGVKVSANQLDACCSQYSSTKKTSKCNALVAYGLRTMFAHRLQLMIAQMEVVL